MPNERMNINRLQRQHMLESMSAASRQAVALERLVVLFEAFLKASGMDLPLEAELSGESEPPATEQSFNPHTESAPGVPLPGQENENG